MCAPAVACALQPTRPGTVVGHGTCARPHRRLRCGSQEGASCIGRPRDPAYGHRAIRDLVPARPHPESRTGEGVQNWSPRRRRDPAVGLLFRALAVIGAPRPALRRRRPRPARVAELALDQVVAETLGLFAEQRPVPFDLVLGRVAGCHGVAVVGPPESRPSFAPPPSRRFRNPTAQSLPGADEPEHLVPRRRGGSREVRGLAVEEAVRRIRDTWSRGGPRRPPSARPRTPRRRRARSPRPLRRRSRAPDRRRCRRPPRVPACRSSTGPSASRRTRSRPPGPARTRPPRNVSRPPMQNPVANSRSTPAVARRCAAAAATSARSPSNVVSGTCSCQAKSGPRSPIPAVLPK